MSGLSVIGWILVGLWTALLLYVIVDVRRIMSRNNRANEKIIGLEAGPITGRGVLINRIALIVVMIGGNWAIWHIAPRYVG